MPSDKNAFWRQAAACVTVLLIFAAIALFLEQTDPARRAKRAKLSKSEQIAKKHAAGTQQPKPKKQAPRVYHEKHGELLEKILSEKIKAIQPPHRISTRRNIVQALGFAQALGQHDEAARLNAWLAQEAYQRSYRTLKAWEGLREPHTGLIRRTFTENWWNGKDAGADCFPFLLLASHYLDKPSEPLWLATLAKEREISTTIPLTIDLQTLAVIKEEGRWMDLFQGAEYVKDGLLSVAERLGRGPWFSRMEEVTQAVMDGSYFEAEAGLLPGGGSEINGDLLQVLPRLYWATGNMKYLQMAERIMEAFLFEVFPRNNGLPTGDWNFPEKKPFNTKLRFRDHGNEIVPGFTEVYLLEKLKGRPQAGRYREPLKAFLDRILVLGRTSDGLWYNTVDTSTGLVTDNSIIDNWGYLLNAYRTFDLAENSHEYDAEIQRAMRAAAALRSHPWEGAHHDGFADSIESMIYQLNTFDIPECRQWVDDEIEVMFLLQHDTGFVSMDYLDGNFIRTALLYGEYKTQGVSMAPWRETLSFGASRDGAAGALHIYANSGEPWKGKLFFDYPRHKAIWNLPLNYPRLNAWPEWFVAEPGKDYEILDLDSGQKRRLSGQELANGLPVALDGKRPLRWVVRPL